MATYVQLGAVKTWYDERGEGEPLVLLGEMAAVEPNLQASELAKVTQRSLVMFSDDDLVTLTHAVEMYDALPNAELAIVPGTSHFLTQEKPELVNKLLVDFLTKEPVATVAPIRRAPEPEVSPG